MELGQPKALGIFDHHDGRIGDIDTDFDHRGADQDIELSLQKGLHDGFFVLAGEPTMQKTQAVGGKYVLLQMRRHGHGGVELEAFRFLNQGVHDVGLPAFSDLLLHRCISLGAAGGTEHFGANR